MTVINKPYDELLIGLENDEKIRKMFFEFSVSVPSQELSYKLLKRWTGQDFGYDIKAWGKWFENQDNEETFYNNLINS